MRFFRLFRGWGWGRGWGEGWRNQEVAAPRKQLAGAMIGDLVGPLATVDANGAVQMLDGSFWLRWGIAVGDEWRLAHQSSGIRQQRVGTAPVYETRMRVSGGDIIKRVGVFNDGNNRTLIVEFENASPQAVAVALVGCASAVELVATRHGIERSGRMWVQPERPAAALATATASEDIWNVIVVGSSEVGASEVGVGERGVGERGGQVAAGLVVTLPHRQTIKFRVVVEGGLPTRSTTPAEIASGWQAITAAALCVEVAETAVATRWQQMLTDLIVLVGTVDPHQAAEIAPLLDIAGLSSEADRARATVVAFSETSRLGENTAVAALRALASRELRSSQDSGLVEFADQFVADAAGSLGNDTINELVWALAKRSPKSAARARQLTRGDTRGAVYQYIAPLAQEAAQLLGCFVADDSENRIDLLPQMPSEWIGRSIDVRGYVTLWGSISFSVRWHGTRPALLWERSGPGAVTIIASAIDPSWSTQKDQGEALLQ
ncbi:MAG: hypothetical protein OXB90_04890 [Acidimicrobiaceae bacterium]|nr:hypothetical protein [Acidimicrobiaceae bacterium]